MLSLFKCFAQCNPVIFKNTTRLKANSFGLYALNGNSVIDFKEHSTKEDVCSFFVFVLLLTYLPRGVSFIGGRNAHF
jgi:hypothetical protein